MRFVLFSLVEYEHYYMDDREGSENYRNILLTFDVCNGR